MSHVKHRSSHRPTRRKARFGAEHIPSAGPGGFAIRPPVYGIDFVTRATEPFGDRSDQVSPPGEAAVQGIPARRAPIRAGEAASSPAVENRTGMPDGLKGGLELLSGLDLSGVRVRYNSTKPARLNARAYTQGRKIEVGPGQERHLPHEGWHAVQQMQGRVRPTMQEQGVWINDDESLEREANVMGARALQMRLGFDAERIPSAGPGRLAIHPPAYGIDFVDRPAESLGDKVIPTSSGGPRRAVQRAKKRKKGDTKEGIDVVTRELSLSELEELQNISERCGKHEIGTWIAPENGDYEYQFENMDVPIFRICIRDLKVKIDSDPPRLIQSLAKRGEKWIEVNFDYASDLPALQRLLYFSKYAKGVDGYQRYFDDKTGITYRFTEDARAALSRRITQVEAAQNERGRLAAAHKKAKDYRVFIRRDSNESLRSPLYRTNSPAGHMGIKTKASPKDSGFISFFEYGTSENSSRKDEDLAIRGIESLSGENVHVMFVPAATALGEIDDDTVDSYQERDGLYSTHYVTNKVGFLNEQREFTKSEYDRVFVHEYLMTGKPPKGAFHFTEKLDKFDEDSRHVGPSSHKRFKFEQTVLPDFPAVDRETIYPESMEKYEWSGHDGLSPRVDTGDRLAEEDRAELLDLRARKDIESYFENHYDEILHAEQELHSALIRLPDPTGENAKVRYETALGEYMSTYYAHWLATAEMDLGREVGIGSRPSHCPECWPDPR